MGNEGTHKTHCCILHGCKYYPDRSQCPVVSWKVQQSGPCVYCTDLEDGDTLEIRVEYRVSDDGEWKLLSLKTYPSVTAALEFWASMVLGPEIIPSGLTRLSYRVTPPWEPVAVPANFDGFEG